MTQSDRPDGATPSRRRLLQTLTAGGSMALAGCGMFSGSENTTDVSGETPTATAQTLRIPVTENPPNKTSFYRLAPDHTFAGVVKEQPDGLLEEFVWESGTWLDVRWATGDLQYTWIGDVTKTPTEITISIRDDAKWSDGRQITGRDIALPTIAWTIRLRLLPFYAYDGKHEPGYIRLAFDDFELNDQSVTYRSSPGYFKKFWESAVPSLISSPVPTHVAPYDVYADAVIETARRAQNGEINPWERKPGRPNAAPSRSSLRNKHLNHRKYVKKFSNAENVLSNSAWDLVELRGSEAFVFEPNPHHRNANELDVERAILEYTASEKRERAALSADRLDYSAPGPTPQTVVDALPDHITQLQIQGGFASGNELGLNFDHPALNKRKVRMAIMYFLDQEAIAKNIHRSAAKPVETPGGDSWDATDYVSQEWIDQNLITYDTDRDRAATLMKEAGYTKTGDQWVDADNEPLTFTLATDNTTPRGEPTVASQLTEFGIRTAVKTFNEDTFEDKIEKGEFPMWAGRGSLTSTAAATLIVWLHAADSPEQYGIYPTSQFKTGRFHRTGTPVPFTEDRWRIFTIEAPPIGEPKGSLQEYHTGALSLMYFTNPPEKEFRRRVKIGMWLGNWFLPTIPINKTLKQHFIDDANWQWPKDTPSWTNFTKGGPREMAGILASGAVRASPDNPK